MQLGPGLASLVVELHAEMGMPGNGGGRRAYHPSSAPPFRPATLTAEVLRAPEPAHSRGFRGSRRTSTGPPIARPPRAARRSRCSPRHPLRLRTAVPATLFERLTQRGQTPAPERHQAARPPQRPSDPHELSPPPPKTPSDGMPSAPAPSTHIRETRRRQRGLRPPLRLTLPDRAGQSTSEFHDPETYSAAPPVTPTRHPRRRQ